MSSSIVSELIVKCVLFTGILLIIGLLGLIFWLYVIEKIEERKFKKNENGRKNM